MAKPRIKWSWKHGAWVPKCTRFVPLLQIEICQNLNSRVQSGFVLVPIGLKGKYAEGVTHYMSSALANRAFLTIPALHSSTHHPRMPTIG